MTINQSKNTEYGTTLTLQSFLVLPIAISLGLLAAVLVLPNWMPDLAQSLLGPDPKAFWYISRATAFVAMGLLWASMMLGVGITNRMARLWPGAPAAFALHEYISLLGLAFATFHGMILLGDHYSNYSLSQLLVPFAAKAYIPFWIGLGQLGFYTWAILVSSFYVRTRIGHKTWRVLHYVSFLAYLAALVHGLVSGSDSSLPWAQWFYWLTGGSFLFLFMYRVVNSLVERSEKFLARL